MLLIEFWPSLDRPANVEDRLTDALTPYQLLPGLVFRSFAAPFVDGFRFGVGAGAILLHLGPRQLTQMNLDLVEVRYLLEWKIGIVRGVWKWPCKRTIRNIAKTLDCLSGMQSFRWQIIGGRPSDFAWISRWFSVQEIHWLLPHGASTGTRLMNTKATNARISSWAAHHLSSEFSVIASAPLPTSRRQCRAALEPAAKQQFRKI